MTAVTIYEGVKKIGDRAFDEALLPTLLIPDSVTEIGDSVFWCCKNLEEISLSSNIKSIGENVFGYCKNLYIFAETGSYAEKYCEELFS